jgi:hypothetical protein
MLARNVYRYDLFKTLPNSNPSVVVLAHEGMNRNSYLAYFPNIKETSDHTKLAHFVHDYYIVNNRYLYAIRIS